MELVIPNIDLFLTDDQVLELYRTRALDTQYRERLLKTELKYYNGIHSYYLKRVKEEIENAKVIEMDSKRSSIIIVGKQEVKDWKIVKREVFTVMKIRDNEYNEIEPTGYKKQYEYSDSTRTYKDGEMYFEIRGMLG